MSEIFKDEKKSDIPKTQIMTKENAKNELKKLFDYYEIDIEEIEDKELKRAIKNGENRLIKSITLGRLQIKLEDGIKVIQTLRENGKQIEYREIDGIAKAMMDGKDPNDMQSKGHALMGSLSGLGENYIKQLKGVDLSLCEVLGLIFLSV